eukprot:gnl/Trimastix_PCT/2959.p2 GENE.gnl/Trimastix_PCT/2959~~gnl/Trimastix_PCT/2959.p2  ORF type:complete len:248 (+),score=67.22 gnl/Trimastix_PCT/2959:881-1624(+)
MESEPQSNVNQPQTQQGEEDESFRIRVPQNGHLSLAGLDLEQMPSEYGVKYGSHIKRLDLSHNKISAIQNIALFTALEDLVLDNNQLVSEQHFPNLPSVTTLWVNNNKIADIKAFLDAVCPAFSHLTYLSTLKNSACPHPLTGGNEDDYRRYRLYVLSRLPSLNFLDSAPCTPEEIAEAKRRGQFCLPSRPAPLQRPAAALPQVASHGVSEEDLRSHEEREVHFGMLRQTYRGTQSEGNKYISNDFL